MNIQRNQKIKVGKEEFLEISLPNTLEAVRVEYSRVEALSQEKSP